ncbi:hypothetical protein BH10ACT11_BH10ACT11_17090 [soil metagenome]
MIKALGHPLRQRILALLNESESSPSDLAGEIGEPIGKVAYHVKILLDYEAIELVRTQPVRGAVEHFYRATIRPHVDDEHWTKLPLSVRRSLFDQTLQRLWKQVVEGAENNGFDAVEAHVSSTTLDLDPQGVEEVASVLNEARERVLAIQDESAARQDDLTKDERKTKRTEVVILHYERSAA